MHLSKKTARAGLLAAAAALIAMLVATSSASAASFGGGTIKIDVKLKSASVATKGHSAKSTFPFAENAGVVTMTKQASGSLSIGAASTSITIKRGSKSIVLQSFVEKLTAGKGQLTAKIKGKGKAIAFFDQASTNKLGPNTGFTQLILTSSKMTLTKAGADALNKAFGLKAPARGKPDLRYKAKAAAGSKSFTANRSLTVVGGQSSTIYDGAFVQALRDCDITLGPVAPATAIPKDASAPEGGVSLPINAANGGTLSANTLTGQVNHQGGTVLDRPAGGPKGKAQYNSPLTTFVFGFQGVGQPTTLTAFIVNANGSLPIGSVSGTPVANLTDTGGSVSLTGGSLNLSDTAAGTLSQSQPPLGADCPIPAGSKIGAINMTANVE